MTDAQQIRQLEQQLAACAAEPAPDVTRKIDLLNELAWALSDIDLKRAQSLSENARALAESPGAGAAPHRLGLAYSLRTLGYLNFRLGNYPLSFSQSLEAQQIFESLEHLDGLPEVFENIAGIYTHIGNIPAGFDYFYKLLDTAQRLNDRERIANASNNLASLYHDVGQIERAIKTYRKNLKFASEIDHGRLKFFCYYNLAACYLNRNDVEQALENGLAALQASRAAGFELFEIYALCVIGETYLKLNDTAQALNYLKQALTLSERLDAKHAATNILWSIAQVYHAQQDFNNALNFLDQDIALAESIDDKRELFKPHLLASEIYEQQGDLAKAMQHFKQYQKYREAVLEDKANQQVQLLQVIHDTEAAKKEAELLQQKTEVLQAAHDQLEERVQERTADLKRTVQLLQQEITERRRVEVELQQLTEELEKRLIARTQELSTFFDLTVLASRAANLTTVMQQAMPRILEVSRSRVICLHLLESDRTTLSLAAHQNLPDEAQTRLQRVELSPALWRWLRQPGDPLVTSSLAALTILPPPFHLPQFQTYLGAQIRIGRRIEGILSCYRFTERGFGLDEISLVAALAEQMGIVLETHRLRQTTAEMAVLKERQRLARDLHDSVTQSLYSLSLLSRAGREAAADGDHPRLIHSLTQLERNTLHTLREMRLLLYELRPADLEQEGLTRAIALRLNTVEQRVGLRLDVHLDELPELPSNYEIELYHIIMEAMNNVIKHAAASHLTLHLTRGNHRLRLLIADNGQGFDPAQPPGGLGLKNIRERVARLNGQLAIISQPGGGVRLEAEIPYPVEETQ